MEGGTRAFRRNQALKLGQVFPIPGPNDLLMSVLKVGMGEVFGARSSL